MTPVLNNNYDPHWYGRLPTEGKLSTLRDNFDRFHDNKVVLESQDLTQKKELDLTFLTHLKNLIQKKELDLTFLAHLEKELLPLSFMSNREVPKLDDEQKQLLLVKFFKGLFLTLAQHAYTLKEKDLKSIHFFMTELSQCSLFLRMAKPQLEQLDGWLQDVIICQKLFRQFTPLPKFPDGNSRGILFKLKKDHEIRGWLFATLHDLSDPQMCKATKLCKGIYERLFQCTILATEIKLTKLSGGGDSIENHLVRFARENGIVNVGLDCEAQNRADTKIQWQKDYHCRDIESDESRLNAPGGDQELKQAFLKRMKEKKEKLYRCVRRVTDAYIQGDSITAKARLKGFDLQNDVVTRQRQTALIHNTHQSLLALEKAGQEEIPKGFFAYGIDHILIDQRLPHSLVNGLTHLGWEVEPDILY